MCGNNRHLRYTSGSDAKQLGNCNYNAVALKKYTCPSNEAAVCKVVHDERIDVMCGESKLFTYTSGSDPTQLGNCNNNAIHLKKYKCP